MPENAAEPARRGEWSSSHIGRAIRCVWRFLMKTNLNKSLQQLDGQDWGEPAFDSRLVVECHRLRRVPLRDFTVENLRITIGQSIGLEHLVTLVLERLHEGLSQARR